MFIVGRWYRNRHRGPVAADRSDSDMQAKRKSVHSANLKICKRRSLPQLSSNGIVRITCDSTDGAATMNDPEAKVLHASESGNEPEEINLRKVRRNEIVIRIFTYPYALHHYACLLT